MTDDQFAEFTERMIVIGEDTGERVREDGERLLERDPVASVISQRLGFVPLEDETHLS